MNNRTVTIILTADQAWRLTTDALLTWVRTDLDDPRLAGRHDLYNVLSAASAAAEVAA